MGGKRDGDRERDRKIQREREREREARHMYLFPLSEIMIIWREMEIYREKVGEGR